MATAPEAPTPELGIIERIEVSARTVACDGGVGPLGHPRVWLKLAGPQVVCPYCSRLYVLKAGATEDAHH